MRFFQGHEAIRPATRTKERPLKLELKNSLSVKLLRVVLLSALLVGVVLSCAQIVFDAYKTRHAVETDA
ncbi:hypothetical protein APX70_00622, partial [Pseudomonas syringae pv. maculicola]